MVALKPFASPLLMRYVAFWIVSPETSFAGMILTHETGYLIDGPVHPGTASCLILVSGIGVAQVADGSGWQVRGGEGVGAVDAEVGVDERG